MVLVTFSGSTFFQFLSLKSSPDRFLDPGILLPPSSSYFLAIPLLRSRTPHLVQKLCNIPCFVPSCFHRLVVFVSGDGRNQKPDISRSQRPTRQDCSRAPWCWQRFCFSSPGRRVAAKALSWYPSVLMKLQDVVRNLEKSMSAKRSHCQQRPRDLFATPKPRSWFSRGGRRSHFKSGETTSSGRGNERRREADVRLGDVVDWRVEVP